MAQSPQEPGNADEGADQHPQPGQSLNGSSGQQSLDQPAGSRHPPPDQGSYDVPPWRPYTESAPVESYTPPVQSWAQPPGQPGSAPWAQPGPPGSAPFGPPVPPPYQPYQGPASYQLHPGQPGGYQPAYQGRDPVLADRSQRLLARLIDSTILVVLNSVLWVPFLAAQVHRFEQLSLQYPDTSTPAAQTAISQAGSRLVRDLLLLLLLYAATAFCYDWLLHARWGQTIGKRATGIMVVTSAGRSKISGGAAGGRAAVYILAPLVPLLGLIFALFDDLWLLWDPGRQCLHDKAAATVVIEAAVRAAPPNPGRPPRAW